MYLEWSGNQDSPHDCAYMCIEISGLNYCCASLCARSFVAEFREPSLDFLGIRLRERLNTELNE